MRDWAGDTWDRFKKSFIVVTTNIGFKSLGKSGLPGPNVMGRGIAAVAASKVPELPGVYGEFCARFGAATPVTLDLSTGLVLFPTKPLGPDPAMSWKGPSTLELIERSARELAAMSWMNREFVSKHVDGPAPLLEDDDVYVPLVGCESGGLDPDHVVPLLRDILRDDRFILVQYRPF